MKQASQKCFAVLTGFGLSMVTACSTDHGSVKHAPRESRHDTEVTSQTPTSAMAMPMPMPTIPPAQLPKGSVGYGTQRIRSTTEQPRPDVIGAFRIVCDFSHMSYDDPIVFPNQPGRAHLHTFFGNTGTNASSTYASLRASGNSTCRGGTANRSAYWIPTLLDGNGKPLVPSLAIFYYKTAYAFAPSSALRKPPDGLRMVAGRASATPTNPQSTRAAHWGCANKYIGHYPSIQDCGVNGEIQLTVTFPQCWDGKNLTSADQSHVAYASNKTCPTTHPYAFPEISINVRWKQATGLDVRGLKLASDMYGVPANRGGFSAHADWFDGWDPAVKEAFTNGCVRANKDCHAHLLGDGRGIY